MEKAIPGRKVKILKGREIPLCRNSLFDHLAVWKRNLCSIFNNRFLIIWMLFHSYTGSFLFS